MRADDAIGHVRIGLALISMAMTAGCVPVTGQSSAFAEQPKAIPHGFAALGRPPEPDTAGTIVVPTTGPISGF